MTCEGGCDDGWLLLVLLLCEWPSANLRGAWLQLPLLPISQKKETNKQTDKQKSLTTDSNATSERPLKEKRD